MSEEDAASNAIASQDNRKKMPLLFMTATLRITMKDMLRELLPRPKGRGFPAASSLLRRHSPLASGRVSREFSVSVSLAQTCIRFAMQRFRSHRTGSGCSLPTLWNRLANSKSPRGRSDRSSK